MSEVILPVTSDIEKLAKRIARAQRVVEELKDPEGVGNPTMRKKRYQTKQKYLNDLRMEMIQLVCSGMSQPLTYTPSLPTQLTI
jgi:hypothetical protein